MLEETWGYIYCYNRDVVHWERDKSAFLKRVFENIWQMSPAPATPLNLRKLHHVCVFRIFSLPCVSTRRGPTPSDETPYNYHVELSVDHEHVDVDSERADRSVVYCVPFGAGRSDACFFHSNEKPPS